MSSRTPAAGPARPREVTVGGMLAVFGSSLALAILVSTMGELNSSSMREVLQQLVDDPRSSSLGLTLDTARQAMKYLIMVLAVLSVTSLVLGFFVLRRDRHSRIVLTVLGGLVLALTILSGPRGWILSAYIGVSLGMLWTRPARAWFADPAAPGPGSPGSGRPEHPSLLQPPAGEYPAPPEPGAAPPLPPPPPPGWRPPPDGWRPPPPPKR